jgi:hypothetical protein
MVSWEAIRQRWEVFGSKLDERGRRLFAAAEARAAGRCGLAAVAEITGLARSTISRGRTDLDPGNPPIFNGVQSYNLRGHFQFLCGCDAADAHIRAVVVVSP